MFCILDFHPNRRFLGGNLVGEMSESKVERGAVFSRFPGFVLRGPKRFGEIIDRVERCIYMTYMIYMINIYIIMHHISFDC